MIKLLRIQKNKQGFTLLEIMIVVLIISVLLMIAVPSWIGARERSQIRGCVAQLRDIKYAKENWAMDNKKDVTSVPLWADINAYLKSQPVCPAGGTYTIGAVNTNPSCSKEGDHTLY